jgi:hypothetical protein
VWTPRRILIFLSTLVGFLAVFSVAYLVLGKYDSLPKLPQQYFWNEGVAEVEGSRLDLRPPTHDFRTGQSFGNESEELKRKSRVWLPTKGVVLAIDEFKIQDDGRILLRPFSAALYPKSKGDQRFPEIHTVQCEYAYLTLDRKVMSLTDLGRGKVVAVELGGARGVKLTTNRKSPEKSDDLELYVTEGKLFFEDARHLIWSNGYVKLLDTQSQPLPTQVTAIGMEVALSPDIGPNRDKKAPPKKADGVSGVEKITLLKNVDMHLYTDARTGFMAGTDDAARKPAPTGRPPEKAHIHIKTNGKFVLDLVKDTARFDAPEQTALAHDGVVVTRHQNAKPPKTGVVTDRLDCDRLDLQFRKKPAANSAAKAFADASGDKDIESAIATAKQDSLVILNVEAEDMTAFGIEMRYYAPLPTSGPRTIIKGAPMHAIRQGNEIRCEELHLKGADKNGNGQEAFAKGPGKIDLLDKKTGKSTTHIHFRDSFTAAKDKDGDRVYDLLTLRGNASYVDTAHKHEMHAVQFMHIWLEDVKSAPTPVTKVQPAELPQVNPPPKPPETAGGSKTRPHKIEAYEKVQVRSPEMNVRDANHLTVHFREQKIEPMEKGVAVLPGIAPLPTPGQVNANLTSVEKGLGDPKLPPDSLPKVESGPKSDPIRQAEKPKRPLELTGAEITAYIATMGNQRELLEFIAEGNVRVTQAADNPKDKGLDIMGSMLTLQRKPSGNILNVFGEPRKIAQVQHNEMSLFGPKVTIDQVDNVAHVEGTGAMHMPSGTTLDGKKKDGHITIHWNKSMWFNGRSADFDGGVVAFQDNGKLQCQQMQATFDRPIDFKKTTGSQAAKIDKILCIAKENEKVFIHEEERAKDNKLIKYQRLLLAALEVDNLEQRMNGSGPGVLDFIGKAAPGDPAIAAPAAQQQRKEELVSKHTRVRFNGQMISFPLSTGSGRQTIFLDQVRVVHQPGENPNADDPNQVGKDGLIFSCQKLTIVQRKNGEKTSQEMIAEGMNGLVHFQAQDFQGHAKAVKYDDRQEQIIFEGIDTAPAVIFKMPKVRGAQPQRLQGTKILYNRKTGEFLLDGVRVISSWLWDEDVSPRPVHFEPERHAGIAITSRTARRAMRELAARDFSFDNA